MIKLFGWETRVGEAIGAKRENELRAIWKRNILELANNNAKCVAAFGHTFEAH